MTLTLTNIIKHVLSNGMLFQKECSDIFATTRILDIFYTILSFKVPAAF